MLTKQEFIRNIRSKYPQYESLDDDTLYTNVLKKYPQYESQIEIPKIEQPEKKGFLKSLGSNIKEDFTQTKEVASQIGGDVAQGLRSLGGDIRKIQTGRTDESEGLLGRTVQRFGEAQEGIKEAKTSEVAGKQSGTTSLLQSMGLLGLAASDTIGDTFMSALNTVATDEVEETVKQGLQKAVESKGGQAVMNEIQQAQEGYEYLKQTDPEKARNYKAFFGALSLASDVAGGFAIESGTKQLGKQTVKEGLEQTVKPKINVNIKGATEQTTQQATNSFDSIKNRLTSVKKGISENIEGIKKEGLTPQPLEVDESIKKALGTQDIPDDITNLMKEYNLRQGGTDLTFREKLSGLSDNEKLALKQVDADTFDTYLEDANLAIKTDTNPTPYAKGAEKAEEAFKQFQDEISQGSKTRTEILKKADIKVNSTPAEKKIKDMLKESFNIQTLTKVDGDYVAIPVKGRDTLIEKAADLKAIKEIENLFKSKTPIQAADRIKKLQNYIYNNYSSMDLSGMSKEMKDFLDRAVGVYNSELKKQLPPQYKKVMEGLSEDIQISKELDRIFKPSEGITNRGEMAMKRLAAGTTTSGEVRRIAQLVEERTGIDLITEARLRQMTMDLVGDNRGKTFFEEIGKAADTGAIGTVEKVVKGIGRKLLSADKEKLSRKIAKKTQATKKPIVKRDFKVKETPKKEPLALPQGVTPKKPIVTPQTSEKAVIQESKRDLSRAKIGTQSKIHSIDPKTGEGFTKDGKSLGIVDKSAAIRNKKSLDNKGGYISPEAMIQDISKSLKTLTPKNILGVSKEIADKLGVSVKKVQKILQEYVSKHGDKLKDKLADLADDIADKTGARAKFMGDEGTGISGKIDAPKELIKHVNKFENAEDFYQRTAGNIRKEFDKLGLRYKSDFEKFFNKYKTDGGEKLLDTINPTGTLFTEYTPKLRANSKIDSSKITTLADTAGKNPNDTITIYRGTIKSQKNMNPGDFVTTNYDLAKSYSGEGYVVSKKVKYSDILDEIDEPLGEEYLYIPSNMQKWK